MPALPDLPRPLSDGVIAVRRRAERDIPEILMAYEDDPRMHLRLGEERPPSGAELGRRDEEAEVRRLGGIGIGLTVTRDGEDLCLGGIDLHSVDWENLRAELGLWLARGVRGHGYAPRVLRLAAAWLFAETVLVRLELHTETDNEPMLAAARVAGFTREGVLRGYTRERGTRVDIVILSLLAGEL